MLTARGGVPDFGPGEYVLRRNAIVDPDRTVDDTLLVAVDAYLPSV